MTTSSVAKAAGTFTLGGDLTVNRLGFGAMRITGKGVWGPPDDHDECIRVLRRAVELGVNFIDTANSYGPYVSEELIREALHPYPDGLVVATKAGLLRTGPDVWIPLGFPAYLRQECEMSLRGSASNASTCSSCTASTTSSPLEDQVGELAALQQEGKIRHIGLSEVDVEAACGRAEGRPDRVGAEHVQPHRAHGRTGSRRVRDPRASASSRGSRSPPGRWPRRTARLQRIAADHDATASQLALAWLLKRSPVMLPIPGTSKVDHLEQNVAAAEIELSDEEFETLSKAGAETD